MVLTQHNLIFTLNDQVKQYPLPQEKVVIDTPFLTKLVRMLIFNTCLVIGFILLIVFLLGQASTSMLTSFCLWLFKKEFPAEKIRRSAFVGWLSVVFLNVALRMVNHGFTLIVCVCIATGISVFSLIWTNKEN